MVSIRYRSLKPTRPFDERALLYEAVRRLASAGISASETRNEVERTYNTRLDLHTIQGWSAGAHSPYGRVYRLPEKPTPDLAYLIGVNFGDTSRAQSSWHHNYTVRLRVTDEAFAREFARTASEVLDAKAFKVWFDAKRRLWQTDVNSLLLYRLLIKPLEELKLFIEHCDGCMAAFLRGFFDAEGSSSGGVVDCSNTNTEVLSYVKRLLESKFSLRVRGPFKQGRTPGTRVRIKGKWYRVNKQCYGLSLGKLASREFATLIGFTIPRKQRGLSTPR